MTIAGIRCLSFPSLLAAATLTIAGCNPKIYSFVPDLRSTGQNDPVHLRWRAKGDAFLLIHDDHGNFPGSNSGKLHDLTLLITHEGKGTSFLLRAEDTLKLPFSSEDSVIVQKQPDGISEDILRNLTLVATLHGKEAISTIQIEIRADSASDEIGFSPKPKGDSLIAADTNNMVRWGNNFEILTVSVGEDKALLVTHSNITRMLNPGDKPDEGFKGTPVEGYWSFSRLMTPEEKNGSQRFPHMLKINITIKHR